MCEISSLQASREPAKGRRFLPQPHAADEGSLCWLLLQPPLCSECAHPARVRLHFGYTFNYILQRFQPVFMRLLKRNKENGVHAI